MEFRSSRTKWSIDPTLTVKPENLQTEEIKRIRRELHSGGGGWFLQEPERNAHFQERWGYEQDKEHAKVMLRVQWITFATRPRNSDGIASDKSEILL